MAAIRDNLAVFREELAALTARIIETTADVRACAGEAEGETASAASLREALAEVKATLEARDTDGMDSALAKLQSLPLTPKTHKAVTDLAQYVLFGDLKKTAEGVNALLDLQHE
jgi:hypothetical protein